MLMTLSVISMERGAVSDERKDEIWVLGATGRIGRSLAGRLARQGMERVVLVGRDGARLRAAAEGVGPAPRIRVLDGIDAIVEAVRQERPRIVLNLLGSYAATAPVLARAALPGGAYVDLANDLGVLEALLGLGDEAERAGSTLITGAGFGVVGTEAVVAHLCAGRPAASAVRVDALASFATEDGVMGEALAESLADVLVAGGRRYRGGEPVPAGLGSGIRRHTLPDGTSLATASFPSGELLAARIASGAPDVDATSALLPASTAMRVVLPALGVMVRIPAVRRAIVRRMGAVKTTAAPRPRPHSWGHAVVSWPDGTKQEGWLRADDAMDFTADVLAVVTARLVRLEAPAGAFTPAAAFGPEIAVEAGATLLDGPQATVPLM